MVKIKAENLRFYYGAKLALQDINVAIEERRITALIGPSGCGKSTALRCLAGLEDVTSGRIWIGDQMVNDVAPKDRDIAMVFQSYALYPHMTVFDNMAFGLKLRKVPKQEIDRRVKETMREILGEIQTGRFAREWILENQAGRPSFYAMRRAEAEHPLEVVGRQLRAMMPWLKKPEM